MADLLSEELLDVILRQKLMIVSNVELTNSRYNELVVISNCCIASVLYFVWRAACGESDQASLTKSSDVLLLMCSRSYVTYNQCQKSLEHPLSTAVYLTIVIFRSNSNASDSLLPIKQC